MKDKPTAVRTSRSPRVAIVCDWLLGIGGAERVVLELHHMFPDAPIYTSQYNPQKIDWFKDADVRTTWLQHLPGSLKKFMPVLRAWTFSHLKLDDYDLVISATGAEAKAVRTSSRTTHICYLFAPTHYYWSRYDQYMQSPGFGKLNWLARFGLRLLVAPMRRWDKQASLRPNYLVTISTYAQSEIKKYYGRDALIIYPPVDTNRFHISTQRQGFVVVGRQTPYKQIDLAVSACTQLNLPLTVIGDGPEHNRLAKKAGPTVTMLTSVNDDDVATYIHKAAAFIFPGLDDFGIVAVEAMSAGLPVIAFRAGGALDYIKPGKTGEFFNQPTVGALVSVLEKFNPQNYDSNLIKKQAAKFDTTHFRSTFRDFIASRLTNPKL
jgi:glycosyltransferase involved in cell wall biosynthesis